MNTQDILHIFDQSRDAGLAVVQAMPDELVHASLVVHFNDNSMVGIFGPGEAMVHLGQANDFNIDWMGHQVGLDPDWKLHPAFQPIVELAGDPVARLKKLTKLNFRGAQATCDDITDSAHLANWWVQECTKVRVKISKIGNTDLDKVVTHPLLPDTSGPLGLMLFRLIIRHLDYHLGQTTQLMKIMGHRDKVPFLYGELG